MNTNSFEMLIMVLVVTCRPTCLYEREKRIFFFYERKKIRIAAVRLSMTPPKRALSPLEAEAARALQRKVRGVTYGGERGNIFDLETVK